MQILITKENGIGIVTVNRPESLNAMNKDVIIELISKIEGLLSEGDIRVIIITGSGEKAFIAGADIKLMQKMNKSEAYEFANLGHKLANTIENSDKPVIAAVNGFALGGGSEIALACHIRVASDNAVFAQPEVKIGLLPGWGGTQRLPRIVGKGLANELIITGRNVTAQEALKIGLVNRVVSKEELINYCIDIANMIMKNSPNAVSESIKLINISSGTELNKGLSREAEEFSELFETEETTEGLTAFVEKRPPKY
ncbi:MAG: enoyl-CoA hydratase-related protein [Candidatus Neomarinimicrobiota bacterium]|nr:enoyl-CoA hydratase-related protein [Candidatus Neomarinimicrobiota bacterium]|tara:strand:- start:6 stop:770 length:765 start_codon:yes stop_codon:yes gene_type:complete